MLLLEELERRDCPSVVCNANPTYQAECAYVNSLVPQADITLTAVQSGNWSNPATWGGRTPTTGDNVWIPNGITVNVDTQEPGALRSISDQGVLTFAPHVDTSLLVNTLVVGESGELDIGTASQPVQAGVTAQLIFADSQSVASGLTQSQLFPNDTDLLSGGLVSMGTLNIYGSQVTPYVNVVGGSVGVGSLSFDLSTTPVGWKAGDTLLLAGTNPASDETEQVQIASIVDNADGTATVTLASPLQYSHSVPMGQSLQIADESRNVVIRDEGTSTQYMDGSNGHVMEMHNDAAHIEYAAFLDPGRSDKSVPEGSTLSNGTVNVPSRYSLHFHECYWPGYTDNDPAIQVIGCFQSGGVGWGYVNHRSNVDFIDDVAYNDFGSAFVDQAADELGSFQNDLAVSVPGVPNSSVYGRASLGDWAWNGQGFWLTSPQTAVIGCHVYDAQLGYDVFTTSLAKQGLPGLPNLFNGANQNNYPLAPFQDNTAAEVNTGLFTYWRLGAACNNDTYSNFAAWDVRQIGVHAASYVDAMHMPGSRLLAAPGYSNTTGVYVEPTQYQRYYSYSNVDVEGFTTGIQMENAGTNSVDGGYLNNAIDFLIRANDAPRTITFTGTITFGANQKDYWLVDAALQSNLQHLSVTSPTSFFATDQILLPDGEQLYFPDQKANYVPVAAGSGLPFAGMTIDQIGQQYGLYLAGEEAPASASPMSGSNGLVGTPTAWTDTYWLSSAFAKPAGTNYTLQYSVLTAPDQIGSGGFQDAGSFVLQAGWNIFTETINGQKHSWLVYGS